MYVPSTIKIDCYNVAEVSIIVGALERIAELRQQDVQEQVKNFVGALPLGAFEEKPLPVVAVLAEAFAPPAPPELRVAPSEQATPVPAPSAADVAKAAQAMYHTSGFAPVRALIDEFAGEGKRVENIPAEKRAEFIARAMA